MATETTPKTLLLQAIRHYSDLDTCQQELVAARWPDGVTCPTCGRKDVGYLANQRRWQCKGKHARRQFSVKVGTIFEDSPIGLDKWLTAAWLITNAKNVISSHELHRAIGVTQKTAWFMLHRIRLAMQTRSFLKMSGHVEVDKTYIGGKARNMHAKKRRELMGKKTNNGMESLWSLLKRTLGGTYISVQPFHPFRYLDEQAYRFNNRKDGDSGRFTGVLQTVTGRRVMYSELIGKKQPA
jgi:transposase-like protein